MKYVFSTMAGYNAVSLTIDENQIWGTGSAELPIVVFSLLFQVSYPFQQTGWGFELCELRCRLSVNNGTWLARPLPVSLNGIRVTDKFRELKDYHVSLEIPFDRALFATLERERNGGNLQLRLDFELFAEELVEVKKVENFGHPAPVWGIKDRHRLTASASVVIPQSTWVEKILPATGYGKIFILELPALPIEQCEQSKAAYDSLVQAQKLYQKGFYHDAVGKCRLALEPFFEVVEENPPGKKGSRVSRLKSSWQTRLGDATYAWLDKTFSTLKKATNEPHHQSSSPPFGQLDAQMLLTVTTAVIAYAVQAPASE